MWVTDHEALSLKKVDVDLDNGKYNKTPVYVKFKHFMKLAGIFADNEVGPRVHDIRHTFAVHALGKMGQDGQDLYCALPILCTFLGLEILKVQKNT
ncbi:hypothetical protein ACNQFZ_20115 [Schinkia sp. CFF1]